MRKNWKLLLVLLLVAGVFVAFRPKNFENPDKDKLLVELVSYVMEKAHYSPKQVNDSFSESVFWDYLNNLDPQKRFFLSTDIAEFEAFKFKIDDQIRDENLYFFDLTFQRLLQRMKEVRAIYPELLDKPFDFQKDETFNADFEKLPYPKNPAEREERWRQILKFSVLGYLDDKYEEQEQNKQKDPQYQEMSFEDLEEKSRESTQKAMDDFFNIYSDLERKDWFSVYLNAIVEEYDPHSYYFSPEDKDRFDTSISGKFEGIGARLQKRNDQIKIVEIISGGPAWKGKELEVGDIILKVEQSNEEPVEISGMRLDDAVKLIKGPKGTKVILTIRKVDGTIQEIPIVRDVVVLEESYAKSIIVKRGQNTLGLINLPQFYADFEDYKNRNAANDIRSEIEQLKKEGMDGLVLDLRDNGGGSLRAVVDIAGLFIDQGPIVQVRSPGDKVEVLTDTDKGVVWDGPLVLLVNELSASASEILAAAMQDYKRGIIIGSKQTYGKGTVQNFINLNNLISSNTHGDVGALKVTIQKYYRINGNSTQLEGVKSDVVVPDQYSYIEVGEREQSNPMPYDQIASTKYQIWNRYANLDQTIAESRERMASSEPLKNIDANARWIKEQQDQKVFSLNFDRYREKKKKDIEDAKTFEQQMSYKIMNADFEFMPYEVDLFKADSTLLNRRNAWKESLSKDIYVEEAINVLEDLHLNYLNKDGKLANVGNKG